MSQRHLVVVDETYRPVPRAFPVNEEPSPFINATIKRIEIGPAHEDEVECHECFKQVGDGTRASVIVRADGAYHGFFCSKRCATECLNALKGGE